MKFLLIRQQDEEGCDYTIGCGTAVEEVEFDSWGAAEVALRADALAYGDRYRLDSRVTSARLVRVDDVQDLDVARWRAEREARDQEAIDRQVQERERAEYERLRAKYETEVGNERGKP